MKIDEVLIVSDMDGTLIGKDFTIPQRNIEAVKKFQKLGDRLCHGFEKLSKKHHIPLFCAAKGSIVELQLGTAQEATTFRDFLQKADIEKYQKLFHTAKAYGVRITPLRGRIYLTTAHTEEDIDKTIEILDVVFSQI